MKAIIDDKLYNTDTSEKLYSYRRKYKVDTIVNTMLPSGWCCTDWEDIDIYKTKKENYFLHCKRDDKEYIEITTLDSVESTIKELNADKYIELFGKVDEA